MISWDKFYTENFKILEENCNGALIPFKNVLCFLFIIILKTLKYFML